MGFSVDRYRGGTRIGMHVRLTANYTGYIRIRQDGRIMFLYGDFGSSCGVSRRNCFRAPVHVEDNLLWVTFDAVTDTAETRYEIRAISHWSDDNDRRIPDWTGWLDLGLRPAA
jgi:hypothetical protein